MDFKVLKKDPGHPDWVVGAVIKLDPNEAEAALRGGLLEEFVAPPVKAPSAQVGTPPPPKAPVTPPVEPPPAGRPRDKF